MNKRYDYRFPFLKFAVGDTISDYPPKRFIPYKNEFKNKKPILLLGCSYAYGEFIDIKENFASKLSKYTNRWVYNLGEAGQGPIYSLMCLNKEKTEPLIDKKPEYIVYLYMFHHINRYYFSEYYSYYREKNWIPFQKYNALDEFYTFSYFRNIQLENYFSDDKNFEKRLKLFFNILSEMKKISDELYPNSKFVFLIYSDINFNLCNGLWASVNNEQYQMDKLFEIMNSDAFKQKIASMGITVITTEELIGRKMSKASDRAENDPHYPHPSPTAWDEITPKFIEYLKL